MWVLMLEKLDLNIAAPLCVKNSNFYKVKHVCLSTLSFRFGY